MDAMKGELWLQEDAGGAFAANDLQESLAKCETQNDNDGKQTQEEKVRGSLASFVNSRKREWIKS